MSDRITSLDLSKARLNAGQQRHLAKDQYKSDQADTLICTPGSTGASGEYARLWSEAGLRVNPGRYTGWETVFITTNGKRRGRKPAHVAEIKRAARAGCVFLTDARCRRPEGGNPYNIGEQEVAELLRSLGYREHVEHNGLVARWTPDSGNTGLQCADGGSIPNDSCAPRHSEPSNLNMHSFTRQHPHATRRVVPQTLPFASDVRRVRTALSPTAIDAQRLLSMKWRC